MVSMAVTVLLGHEVLVVGRLGAVRVCFGFGWWCGGGWWGLVTGGLVFRLRALDLLEERAEPLDACTHR